MTTRRDVGNGNGTARRGGVELGTARQVQTLRSVFDAASMTAPPPMRFDGGGSGGGCTIGALGLLMDGPMWIHGSGSTTAPIELRHRWFDVRRCAAVC